MLLYQKYIGQSNSLFLVHLQILWTFSIYLESVAILPQLFMVSKTGEAETITSHYLFALGVYRALYLFNWIWRYQFEGFFDLIAIVAGLVQTVLYCDFFYLYITKGTLKLESLGFLGGEMGWSPNEGGFGDWKLLRSLKPLCVCSCWKSKMLSWKRDAANLKVTRGHSTAGVELEPLWWACSY